MKLGRRRFLLGATAVVGASATPLWARWLFDQTAKLMPKPRIVVIAPAVRYIPVPGQPGLYQNSETGDIFNLRDFREGDKYDSVLVPTGVYHEEDDYDGELVPLSAVLA